MLLKRFLKYVKIDTQSNDFSPTSPSTEKQWDLLNLLKSELDKLGVQNELTKNGRLYAFVQGDEALDAIGVCAHVDTAPDFSGTKVNPQIVENYNGKRIHLGESGRILDPKEYDVLNSLKGKTLITTDGTTLLGADDKAGVSIIMEVLEAVLKLKEDERRPMYILFTPDEEVGRGAEEFDTEKFKAKFAYTFDGSYPNIINIETFNAKAAEVKVIGKTIHPGSAKGIMVNAGSILADFITKLPSEMVPEKTEGYEGFNHLTDMQGNCELAVAHFILRNHNKAILTKQVQQFNEITLNLRRKYPNAKIELKIKDQYRNMIEIIDKQPECKNFIEGVFKKLDIEPQYEPVRGGTDGATFSFKGCPTPNLGTGSYNHHGPYEFAVLEEMEQLVRLGVEIFKK
ncbi:MAG: peptidase T [Bacilli bacterium]|nr:peptidase T [Bacilli bacterium]